MNRGSASKNRAEIPTPEGPTRNRVRFCVFLLSNSCSLIAHLFSLRSSCQGSSSLRLGFFTGRGLRVAQRPGVEANFGFLMHVEAGPCRNQVAENDVFLQANQVID